MLSNPQYLSKYGKFKFVKIMNKVKFSNYNFVPKFVSKFIFATFERQLLSVLSFI